MCNLFVQHTSASLTINENADPDVRRYARVIYGNYYVLHCISQWSMINISTSQSTPWNFFCMLWCVSHPYLLFVLLCWKTWHGTLNYPIYRDMEVAMNKIVPAQWNRDGTFLHTLEGDDDMVRDMCYSLLRNCVTESTDSNLFTIMVLHNFNFFKAWPCQGAISIICCCSCGK